MKRLKLALAGAAGAVVLIAAVVFVRSASLGGGEVVIPALSEVGQRGQAAFGTYCASCHGADAGGTGSGPPLIHIVYHPGHHGDMAFVMAAQRGSQAHHWKFGDMPPVTGISEAEIADIIAFIREVQKANGIF